MTNFDGMCQDAIDELHTKHLVLTENGRQKLERWLEEPVRKFLAEPVWFEVGQVAGFDGVELVATGECQQRCALALLPEHVGKMR